MELEGFQVNFLLNSSLLNKPSDTHLSEIEKVEHVYKIERSRTYLHIIFYAERRPLMPKEHYNKVS